MKINNMPDYANDYKYVVARIVDDDLWFWGAYNDYRKAINAAIDTGGIVVAK